MGWCSATEIFDEMIPTILKVQNTSSRQQLIKQLITTLRNRDWDCEPDSKFYENSVVRQCFQELDPHRYSDDEEENADE